MTDTIWLKRYAILIGLLLVLVDRIADSGREMTTLGFAIMLAGGLYPVLPEEAKKSDEQPSAVDRD